MDISHFQKTYQTFSDIELIKIAGSTTGYVINARMAAIQLLKERNIRIPEEKLIQSEYNEVLEKEKK